jgi:hypothetical protein
MAVCWFGQPTNCRRWYEVQGCQDDSALCATGCDFETQTPCWTLPMTCYAGQWLNCIEFLAQLRQALAGALYLHSSVSRFCSFAIDVQPCGFAVTWFSYMSHSASNLKVLIPQYGPTGMRLEFGRPDPGSHVPGLSLEYCRMTQATAHTTMEKAAAEFTCAWVC